ncbi:MaoC/PaaZ C-terminal domain-containing protein [Haloferax denitrificans]|uniref:Acyl dehydratase n=1 Tax=Haloferax denitrificans ATCC 35960 TaxID=662478 RepID=M0JD58_9EURY|nr:MaoC/PaaZ C-terminal domain-containing protein [Haloferax denitrificans]EMA06298.1 acyl dehydratase [Haloferax denitrificans ATCC 35960]
MPVATVGDRAVSERAVTEETIDRFAEVSGDENPIHLDAEYAAETTFGGRIAHGMLAASVVSAALARLPGDIVYLSQDLSFERPVRPGDTVVAEVAVVEEVRGDRLAVETTASVGDETVVSGEAVVLSLAHDGTGETDDCGG